jgi:hypothetical protein
MSASANFSGIIQINDLDDFIGPGQVVLFFIALSLGFNSSCLIVDFYFPGKRLLDFKLREMIQLNFKVISK